MSQEQPRTAASYMGVEGYSEFASTQAGLKPRFLIGRPPNDNTAEVRFEEAIKYNLLPVVRADSKYIHPPLPLGLFDVDEQRRVEVFSVDGSYEMQPDDVWLGPMDAEELNLEILEE